MITYTDNRTTIIYFINRVCQIIFKIFLNVKKIKKILLFNGHSLNCVGSKIGEGSSID